VQPEWPDSRAFPDRTVPEDFGFFREAPDM
jgi:hypothetical protein